MVISSPSGRQQTVSIGALSYPLSKEHSVPNTAQLISSGYPSGKSVTKTSTHSGTSVIVGETLGGRSSRQQSVLTNLARASSTSHSCRLHSRFGSSHTTGNPSSSKVAVGSKVYPPGQIKSTISIS